MSTIRSEDLGDMGESFFKSLCKSIGLIANKSDDDKAGWDYEVEHPKNREINYANQSYPVYRIQVKSSVSNANAVSITYSNLLNLIQYPGASFIILLKYAANGLSPIKGYLKHVSKDFGYEILKRLRKRELKNPSFSINKNKTKINFHDDEELTPFTGAELKKIFQKSIGQRYLTYIAQKVKHLENLEKEGKTKIFETTFKSEKDFKDMIDTLLGYDKKFFMDVEEFNAPFGMKDATSLSIFKKHQTKFSPIEKELETAKIYLRNSKYGSQYKFEGTIYTPPLKLPKKYEKMRIKTALFDLIFSPDQGQLKFDTEDPFNNDKKVKFKELYSFIKFFQDANEASNTYLRLESSNPKTQPAELCLGLQSISCSKDIKIMFKIIEATYKRLSDLNLENEFISTQSILENLSNFQLFDLVNKEYNPNFELPFNSNFDGDPSFCNVVLFSSTIKLINIQLVSYSAFFGTIEKLNDSKFIGKFYKSEYLGDFYQDYSSDIKDAIEKESIHFEKELRDRGFIVFT